MTFKEFSKWCNHRAGDGCWGSVEAMICIDIIQTVNKVPFWKREKFWKLNYEEPVLNEIVKPIEKKIKEVYEDELRI
jgi:hypothetical protein